MSLFPERQNPTCLIPYLYSPSSVCRNRGTLLHPASQPPGPSSRRGRAIKSMSWCVPTVRCGPSVHCPGCLQCVRCVPLLCGHRGRRRDACPPAWCRWPLCRGPLPTSSMLASGYGCTGLARRRRDPRAGRGRSRETPAAAGSRWGGSGRGTRETLCCVGCEVGGRRKDRDARYCT
jgi:hypothetical protein